MRPRSWSLRLLLALGVLAAEYGGWRYLRHRAEPPPALTASRDPLANPGRVTHTRIDRESEGKLIEEFLLGNLVGSFSALALFAFVVVPKRP